jgi:uncharacterized protein YxjI
MSLALALDTVIDDCGTSVYKDPLLERKMMDQTGHRGATLLGSPTLLVKQKLKLIELKNEYEVFHPDGYELGRVVQVRQSPLALISRIFSDLDVMLPVHLEVRDAAGNVLLHLSKPWFRWVMNVSRPDGTPLGAIGKQFRLGKARFTLTGPSGEPAGEVQARNWRAKDFSIVDATGRQVGEVNKKFAGLRELFTDADNYVVHVDPSTPEPLRSLVVASCLTIDTIMKQKDSG